jgi:hypothetical protein
MPKTGPTTTEWRNRLRRYAKGEFVFQRGQKPKRGTVWATVLLKIDKCPQHKKISSVDALGKPIQCTCGYHNQPAPSSTVGNTPQSLPSQSPTPVTTQSQPLPTKDAAAEVGMKKAIPYTHSCIQIIFQEPGPSGLTQPGPSGLTPPPKRPRVEEPASSEV